MTQFDRDGLVIGGLLALMVGVTVLGFVSSAKASSKRRSDEPGPEHAGARPIDEIVPRPTPELPVTPAPDEDVPEDVRILLDGGAPLREGFEVMSWYSYRGMWIRVDVAHDVDSNPGHPHGRYCWTAISGEATPLATECVGDGFGEIVTFTDGNTDYVAGVAAEWIDGTLAPIVEALPMPNIGPQIMPLPIRIKPKKGGGWSNPTPGGGG